MYQVFFGVVRRCEQKLDKITIIAEDNSEELLHKDLPLSDHYLGGIEDINVPPKYKNKPIPMVFGHVDRSPAVFKTNEHLYKIGEKKAASE